MVLTPLFAFECNFRHDQAYHQVAHLAMPQRLDLSTTIQPSRSQRPCTEKARPVRYLVPSLLSELTW